MKAKLFFLSAVMILTSAVAAYAHHSFAAAYFEDQIQQIEGDIAVIQYRNPHTFLHVDAKNEAGVVTVNDVDVSGDLKTAAVFISILGNADQQKRGMALLAQHRPRIQDMMARSVVLKYTPKLRFVLDESVARGNKVLQIIETRTK